MSQSISRLRLICPLLFATAFVACKKPMIRSTVELKEPPEEQPQQAADPAAAEEATAPAESLGFVMPDTWTKQPADKMNVAKFSCGEGDNAVSINVTPLLNLAGREEVLINMMRGQFGQTQLGPEEAGKSTQKVPVGSDSGAYFEVSGKSASGDVTVGTAFVHREDRTWFFKLQGSPTAVQAQKETFFSFLKTVQFRRETGL
jgi:hypothetical protein